MQRRALTVLFSLLALALLGIAVGALVGADGAKRWVVGGAALVLAAWFASSLRK